MGFSDSLLPEFDREMAVTRKVLERVPDDRPGFKPHPKSMALARLAGHLAELTVWARRALEREGFEMTPAPEPYSMTSRSELLERFDANVAAARAALASASEADFARTWTLTRAGKTVFAIPRSAVIRNMVLNHTIHHRAQLGVYLRLNDVAVPAAYGPSADEGGF